MRERPILFSAPMVRAILAGAKTQTRRVIPPTHSWPIRGNATAQEHAADIAAVADMCKYGQPGDQLWVKEGVVQIGHERPMRNGQYPWPKLCDKFTEEVARNWLDKSCFYTADEPANSHLYDEPHGTLNKMFMPRWASRITLEITGVKVERLNEISEEDAVAEGCTTLTYRDGRGVESAKLHFRTLWQSINGPGSWEVNPWVWAITFRKST